MRRAALAAVLVLIGSLGALLRGQQANFTGTVRSLDAADVRAVRFQYDAGARSYWHTHAGSQILVLEKGRGRVQQQGKPVREMVPGEPVFLAAGVPHWHGAAPNEGLTQIAVNLGGVKWMQPVTDAEYLTTPVR
jgi:quercetin dioxygenase-like cupin family protein